jgi:hypothetical protein
MKNYIGVDPGHEGAITLIFHDGEIRKFIMPLIGKQYNIPALNSIFSTFNKNYYHIILEDVHAIYGSSAGATFEFGYGAGLLEGLIVAHGLPYTKVQPKEWQKIAFQGIKEIRKPSKKNKNGKEIRGKLDTKPMALLAVQRLFPKEDLRGSERCRVPHKGVIDSLLLAYYGQCKNL